MAFTVVFEGDIAKFEGNPLRVNTPFGKPFAIGMGNALDQIEGIHEIENAAQTLLDVIAKSRAASD